MSDDHRAWGGLSIAGMSLALPLDALREVMPFRGLSPLPCASASVIGGIAVRGVTVPVLDLAPLLQRDAPPADSDCVVIVAHAGRLLGLRAQGVSGIFAEQPGSRVAAVSAVDPGQMFAGSVRRTDPDALVNLLSVPALAAVAGVPWVEDPEPQRQASAVSRDAEAPAAVADDTQSLMLLRCGPLRLAIDAISVHATLWQPKVQPSPLTRGACRGVIEFNGLQIGAADLLALCGLGQAEDPRRAIVVRHGAGFVALLVDSVIEIVRVPASSVAPLAGLGTLRRGLLRGMLSGRELGADLVDAERCDFIVLEPAGLLAGDELAALAATNTGTQDGGAAQLAGRPGRALLTFRLPQARAVPLVQVREILPFGTHDALFGPDAVLRRIQVLRGRSVPVLCLARLLGGSVEALDDAAAVLVVEAGEDWIGFAVPRLESIASAKWERRLGQRDLAAIGDGDQEHTLDVLDLQALARELVAGGDLLAA